MKCTRPVRPQYIWLNSTQNGWRCLIGCSGIPQWWWQGAPKSLAERLTQPWWTNGLVKSSCERERFRHDIYRIQTRVFFSVLVQHKCAVWKVSFYYLHWHQCLFSLGSKISNNVNTLFDCIYNWGIGQWSRWSPVRKHFLPYSVCVFSQHEKKRAQCTVYLLKMWGSCEQKKKKNQEGQKRKQRAGGRQRRLLYVLTHVG